MRTFGRVPVDPANPNGAKRWVVVETDAKGYNDGVYITAIAQTLKLNLNESPFWANFGIPARESVMQQIFPDLYAVFTQQYYSQFFASLIISRRVPEAGFTRDQQQFAPVYDISAVTQQGFTIPAFRPNTYPV